VISGNGNDGVQIDDANSNVVAGNKIGTDATGTVRVGNAANGVEVDAPTVGNTIGGTASGAGNIISGNYHYGVRISGSGATDNLVVGNTLGTDVAGKAAFANAQGGVAADAGTSNNTMGGLSTTAGTFHGFDFASGTSSAAVSLHPEISGPPQQQTGAGATSVYRIDEEVDGEFLAIVHPQGFTARLMMLDSQGRVLMQSDGQSAGNADDLVQTHLPPGSFTLEVQDLGGAGSYTLTTRVAPATAPFDPLPVGQLPDSIVAGDFRSDGRTDLAVANEDGTVSVLLSNGDGTFQPQITFAVGVSPTAIVAGDFTGHGHLDLALAGGDLNTGAGEVAVLLGNGDGTFQPQLTYPVGGTPTSIVAGDFRGDGRTDLAVANEDANTVSVLVSNGDGTFQPQVTYPVGPFPDSIVAGDFAGDGRTDLAVANRSDNTVSVLLGNGDGTFQPQVTYPVGQSPNSIVAGDFRGDGHLDLAVANSGGVTNKLDGNVSVLLGNGDGTFQPLVTYPVGLFPDSIAAGDFRGDGRTDLAVANEDGNV
jgi:hypothetical protein